MTGIALAHLSCRAGQRLSAFPREADGMGALARSRAYLPGRTEWGIELADSPAETRITPHREAWQMASSMASILCQMAHSHSPKQRCETPLTAVSLC